MENLLALLDKIQQISPLPVLSQEIIIVHNAGMQHWLNLSLAKQRGISMNFSYALPSQYLWKLVRSLASADKVPEQSPYSREVLTWRLDHLLASVDILADDDFEQVNYYWKNEKNSSQAKLKRFQLAMQLADLFEQYLIFRPQWLDDWQHNKISTEFSHSEGTHELMCWQRKLWLKLIAEFGYNPKAMITSAIENIAKNKQLLPPRLSFFGINSLAPIWLEFISALSEHIDVHFFHLNPCYDYWGDILTEKQAVNSLTRWVDSVNSGLENNIIKNETNQSTEPDNDQALSDLIGNPLLANLGQQGREFLALLQQYSTINIDAFEHTETSLSVEQQTKVTHEINISVLQQVQNDILSLKDARLSPQEYIDDSIVVTSCHSALREVQGLHDWLLHQFNQDASLTPKDILVMCPQVEHYAPYIDAVFSRSWQEMGDDIPPLPCSIADRISKDSEPLVAAFLTLLQLPDSRFQVSKIIELLRLPALQTKFNLSLNDIDKITQWLEQAAIHWGLDGGHKQSLLNLSEKNEFFTWHYGLSRLLLGFAFGDETCIYQDKLLLPTIEGNDALLLGKLCQLIEQLQYFAKQMAIEKTATQWLSFLHELLAELFVTEDDNALDIIHQALANLVDYCDEAKYYTPISLVIIREFLQNQFSQPDPGRQFLVGQVTFCSMLPMRSIPFKIIAILGLNDGEFPRQRQPLGFDLMSITPPQVGDRSRRGDDRYLFLEAIICARKALYLSYQGRNIRNNNELQPSLVLKELMEYLDLGYGWLLLNEQNSDDNLIGISNKESEKHTSEGHIRQLPMQAFSERNYQGVYPSFDKNWLNLNYSNSAEFSEQAPLIISNKIKQELLIDLTDLVSFFNHPAKYFAKHQLNLHFERYDSELSDTEPFTSNSLAIYQLKEALLMAYLRPSLTPSEVITAASLSGQFPDLPTMKNEFEHWRQDSQALANTVRADNGDKSEYVNYRIKLVVENQPIILTAKLALNKKQCVNYRSSTAKAKDLLTLYLQRLFTLVWQQQSNRTPPTIDTKLPQLDSIEQSVGWYFDTKNQQISKYYFTELDFTEGQNNQQCNAGAMLSLFIQQFLMGQQQALLLNAELGEQCCKPIRKRYSKEMTVRIMDQINFEHFWHDDTRFQAYINDPYIQFFWRDCPDFSTHKKVILELYQALYQQIHSEVIKVSEAL